MPINERQAGAEIEVTSEMMESGYRVFCDSIVWGGDDSGFFDDDGFVDSREMLRRIYLAMKYAELHQALA